MTATATYHGHSRTPLAFGLSVVIHGIVVAALVAFVWKHPTPKPQIISVPLEMVSGPADNAPTQDTSTRTTTDFGTIKKLDTTPVKISTPTPDVTQTQPENVKPTVVNPSPKATSTVKTTQDIKTAKPSQASSTTKVTTAADFWKQLGISNPNQTRPAATGGKPVVSNVGISNHAVNTNSGGSGSSRQGSSTTSDTDNQNYINGLIARLHDALVLPGGISGLVASVTLTIAPDGTVEDAQLVSPSGDAQFDAAVRAALARITHVDPTPDNQRHKYSFTYTPSAN